MVKVRVWRITRHGRTVWATAQMKTEEEALSWAVDRLLELLKRGFLGSIQIEEVA